MKMGGWWQILPVRGIQSFHRVNRKSEFPKGSEREFMLECRFDL